MVWPMLISAVASLAGSAMQNKGQKDIAEGAAEEKAADREFMMQQISRARNDLGQIYPAIQQNTMMGGQAALDVLRGAYGAQAGVYDQSSNNAMAAILGGQMNPYTIDQSYLNVAMPNFQQVSIPQDMGPYQMQDSSSQQDKDVISEDLDKLSKKTGFGAGQFMSLGDKRHFEADTIFNNPLRLNDKNRDRLDPVKGVKRVFGGLF